MKVWGGFFPDQLTTEPVAAAALADNTVPIGGSAATVIPAGTTDTGHSSLLYVPELSLVVSGDVAYNQTHMWMARSTSDTRASWLRALDTAAQLDADTLIAGHRHPQAPDDDARRQIAESRRYIADFEAALEQSSTPAELIDRMTTAYPDLANPYTLWVAAYDLLGPPT
jgi:glyoxylase-like metal-dependent hydrolase (beta-lactamase superfamily II)